MKNAVFWNVAPCRSCMNRRFGGTYRLNLQGKKIRERGTSVNRWLHPRRRHSSLWVYFPKNHGNDTFYVDCACHLLSHWFLAQLILLPWRWRRHITPKRLLTFNLLRGVMFQKMELFITIAVRTSNPTRFVNITETSWVWIHLCLYGSAALLLDFGHFFSFLILYTVGRTPWTGDQPVARPLPTHRTM
jgi:hypothetical protein